MLVIAAVGFKFGLDNPWYFLLDFLAFIVLCAGIAAVTSGHV